MPYVDLAGLSRYASRQKERLERDCALLRDMQWTRSEKAGVVSLWPASSTPLEPVVDFLFAETPPVEGEKGPDNPSTITGVSSVNVGRIGKNLLLAVPDNTDWYGISITRQADGSYLLNGTSWSGQQTYFPLTDSGNLSGGPYSSLHLDPSKTYTLSARIVSGIKTGGAAVSAISTRSMNWIVGSVMQLVEGSVVTATRSASSLVTGEFICRLNVESGASFNNVVLQVQLEEGSTATGFEAPMLPTDAKYDISLGSTYYGGTLDVATGVMTVTHGRLELNENTGYSSTAGVAEFGTIYRLTIYPSSSRNKSSIASQCACNIFPVVSTNTSNITCIRVGSNSSAVNVDIDKSLLGLGDGENYTTVKAAFDSFFSSHPGVFVYPIANPIIVQLDPVSISALAQPDKYTPRLNTVYTDAQSVQVGYIKSPIRDEYELTQAITAQGGNV